MTCGRKPKNNTITRGCLSLLLFLNSAHLFIGWSQPKTAYKGTRHVYSSVKGALSASLGYLLPIYSLSINTLSNRGKEYFWAD